MSLQVKNFDEKAYMFQMDRIRQIVNYSDFRMKERDDDLYYYAHFFVNQLSRVIEEHKRISDTYIYGILPDGGKAEEYLGTQSYWLFEAKRIKKSMIEFLNEHQGQFNQKERWNKIWSSVFVFLTPKELARMRAVCSNWKTGHALK